MESVHAGAVQTHFFEFNLDSEMLQEHISQTSNKTPKATQNGGVLPPFCRHFPGQGFRRDFGPFVADLVPKWVPNGPPVWALL